MVRPIRTTSHAPGCRFRTAAECAVPVACEHGWDACPACDPCTCGVAQTDVLRYFRKGHLEDYRWREVRLVAMLRQIAGKALLLMRQRPAAPFLLGVHAQQQARAARALLNAEADKARKECGL